MFQEYDELTDEGIIELVRTKDDDAMDYLLKKYSPMVKRASRTMYIIGADSEDLMQEGMLGLFKAVRDYNVEAGMAFYNFARMCIERQIYTAVTASNRKKHSPLNSYVSIYSDIEDSSYGTSTLADILEAGIEYNPEAQFIGKENVNAIKDAIDDKLSKFEKDVLNLYLEGLSYMDIGDKLGKPVKSIDNAIQRIRGKLAI